MPYRGYCPECKHCKQEMELPRPKRWLTTITSMLATLFLGVVSVVLSRREKILPEPVKITISPNGFVYQNGSWVEDVKYYDGQNIRLIPYEHDGVVDFRMEKR